MKNIRNAELSDSAAISRIYAPFVTEMATSFELIPPDSQAMAERIRAIAPRYAWLVFEAGGEVLGYAYGSTHRSRPAYQWSVEVTVYLDQRAQGKGVGRALYSALLEVLRHQGYVRAFAGIALPNPASVGLHEAIGFSRIGVFPGIGFKFGQWHDVLWLQLQLREDAAPSEPLPVEAVWNDPKLSAFLHQCVQGTRIG